jgi:hypothetical protein
MADQNGVNSSVPESYERLSCSSCLRSFFAVPELSGSPCPLCKLGTLNVSDQSTIPVQPEAILPFTVGKTHLQSICANFIKGVWIKPEDFTNENLISRSIPLFWPLWLVDADAHGDWQMEAGFNYQVESAKEAYGNGQWQSIKEVKTRIRWEPRLGEFSTHIDNVSVPALTDHQNRLGMTGSYPFDQSQKSKEALIEKALLEVPDIPTENAWAEAKPKFDARVENICQQAAGAQHSKEFKLNAEYDNLNWTQFFLPLYATHYKDDNGEPQIVIVNGQTGQINGPQLASPKRGLKIAGIIGIVAVVFFILGLLTLLISLAVKDARVVAGLFAVLGLGTGFIALIPIIQPRIWNRNQKGPRIAKRR